MSEIVSLYAERAQCVVALARAARAMGLRVGFGEDPKEPSWPVLFIDLPSGQVSWHFSADDRATLAPDIGRYDGVWDGHTTDEKYARLAAWKPEGFFLAGRLPPENDDLDLPDPIV